MAGLPEEFLQTLDAMLGPGGLRRADAAALLDPGIDPNNLNAGLVAAPSSTGDAAEILKLCAEEKIPVVPQGGRTGLSGAAVSREGELILSTARLNRIVSLDPLDAVAEVEAGVTLQALQEAAAEHGLSPGIDLGARGGATIGGLIATNAGGIEAFRKGVTRHRVLGLEAVLPSGRIVSDLKRVTKANEGIDVKQLFIGAEGTLGLITRAVLRLDPITPPAATALVACANAKMATALFSRLRAQEDLRLLACEIMWRGYAETAAADMGLSNLLRLADGTAGAYVLVETGVAAGFEDALMSAAEDDLILDAMIAKNDRERDEIWRIREDSWAIDRQYPDGFWYDVSVPLAQLDDYLAGVERRVAEVHGDLRVFVMGHLGDGNLHFTISAGRPLPDLSDQVADAVYHGLAESGGSFSAEHGIGLEKRASLAKHANSGKLETMRAIKRALDPEGIMNPGKVL